MKKLLSLVMALSLTAACGVPAMAADRAKSEPDVVVDGSKILFEDQNATIVNDITLVPARGVFEIMGCDVEWDNDTETATITTDTGVRFVEVTIGSNIMKVYTYKSLMELNCEDVELEVPAKLMNDRTMIPLRAISEAMDCKVDWDEENYIVNITTGDPILLDGYTYTAPSEDSLVHMSLSTDKTGALTPGEEFTVYVNAENIPEGSFCSGVVATFEYDKEKFEYIANSGSMITDNDAELIADASNENTEINGGTKVIFIKVLEEIGRTTPGKVYQCKFKSITGEPGTIGLGNDYNPLRGYGSYLMFTTETADTEYNGKNLIIGAPLTIGE